MSHDVFKFTQILMAQNFTDFIIVREIIWETYSKGKEYILSPPCDIQRDDQSKRCSESDKMAVWRFGVQIMCVL